MTIAILAAALALALALTLAATAARAQSIDGFGVGQDVQAAIAKHDPPTESGKLKDNDVYRWAIAGGTTASVTAAPKTGKIIFIESDWGGDANYAATDVPGLTFGATTLADIRTKFGSNGFIFKQHALHMDAHDIISVNCYALAADKKVALAVVTTQAVADLPEVDGKPQIDTGRGVLQAVILADLAYLQTIWGKDRVADDKAHPIDWK
ncbi:MAG TPA: hypothetical protein VGG27_01320 [Magnetospirillaceae bacterium]